MNTRETIAKVLGVFLSLLAAFFGAFLVLFTDVFTLSEKAGAVVYVLIVYFVASLLMHWRAPGQALWRWLLLAPAFLAILLIGAQDLNRAGYTISVALAVLAGTWSGRAVCILKQKPASRQKTS